MLHTLRQWHKRWPALLAVLVLCVAVCQFAKTDHEYTVHLGGDSSHCVTCIASTNGGALPLFNTVSVAAVKPVFSDIAFISTYLTAQTVIRVVARGPPLAA